MFEVLCQMTDNDHTVKCPECGYSTSRILLAGKQGICINRKCKVDRFTVQSFKAGVNPSHKEEGKKNKSYKNSPRRD